METKRLSGNTRWSPEIETNFKQKVFDNRSRSSYRSNMTSELVLGESGRIEIPASVREELQLLDGDSLQIETVDGRIVLSPFKVGKNIRKKQGVWVYHSEGSPGLSVQMVRDLIDEGYEAREQRILGLEPKMFLDTSVFIAAFVISI